MGKDNFNSHLEFLFLHVPGTTRAPPRVRLRGWCIHSVVENRRKAFIGENKLKVLRPIRYTGCKGLPLKDRDQTKLF